MRKEIILPATAAAGGAAGFILRRWELASAFEPDTGLHIPGMPATWALILLSVAVAAVFLLLGRGKHRPFAGGYDAAFAVKGNTVYIMAVVLSAFLLLASAVFNFLGLPAAYRAAVSLFQQTNQGNPFFTVFPRVLLGLLAAASFFCVLASGRNNYRGEGKGRFSITVLMPAYMACLWLIAAYQDRAGDPVRQDYIYELFAIIASLLGLYYMTGFAFERAKVFRCTLCSLMGVYFSLVTLADAHSLYVTLLYGFLILYLTANTAVLLGNDARTEPKGPRMCPAEEQTEPTIENETEEIPHEE